jgi:G3E family GTPase
MPAPQVPRQTRMTPQQRAVLDLLHRTDRFRSAQQLHRDLRQRHSVRIGLVTVYRILHVFADMNISETGCIDPSALVDLLEEPPAGVYRIKGAVAVQYRASVRTYVVHLVGTSIHIASTPLSVPTNCLVAIGIDLDTNEVRVRLDAALRPRVGPALAANVRRLQWYRRLSI